MTKQGAEQGGLADRAHDSLRGRILLGDLAPGYRLSDSLLAQELEISRAPVREAIRRLAAEQLVTIHPHRGAFVRSYSPRDVLELYELRVLLESWAIRQVIERGVQMDGPSNELESMVTAAAKSDREGFVEAEYRFHVAIVRLAGNQWLERCYELVGQPVKSLLALDSDNPHGSLVDDVEAHQRLLGVVSNGDPRRAEAEVRRHIRWVPGLIDRLGEPGDDDA